MDEVEIAAWLARMEERLVNVTNVYDGLQKLYDDLHKRISGKGFFQEGLEWRTGKIELDVGRIGDEIRAIRSLLTGNGGDKSFIVQLKGIEDKLNVVENNVAGLKSDAQRLLNAVYGDLEKDEPGLKKQIEELEKYNQENPSLTWMFKNHPVMTAGIGVGVWVLISMLYDLGLLPAIAKVFGFPLP